MKFLTETFVSLFAKNNYLIEIFEWLEYQNEFNDYFIVRCLTGICILIVFVPLVLLIFLIINFEFFMSKLIFRHKELLIKHINQDIRFSNEIQPWLKSSLPWYGWTYFNIDGEIPILFKNRLYENQVLEIRFLTKNQHSMFKLAWGGEFTHLN